jgi:hypothetical protein
MQTLYRPNVIKSGRIFYRSKSSQRYVHDYRWVKSGGGGGKYMGVPSSPKSGDASPSPPVDTSSTCLGFEHIVTKNSVPMTKCVARVTECREIYWAIRHYNNIYSHRDNIWLQITAVCVCSYAAALVYDSWRGIESAVAGEQISCANRIATHNNRITIYRR